MEIGFGCGSGSGLSDAVSHETEADDAYLVELEGGRGRDLAFECERGWLNYFVDGACE